MWYVAAGTFPVAPSAQPTLSPEAAATLKSLYPTGKLPPHTQV